MSGSEKCDAQFEAAAMPASDSFDMSDAPLGCAAQAYLDALRELPDVRAWEAAVASLASRTSIAKPAPAQASREPTTAMVSDGSVLWNSGGEQINFTTLNATEKAREAVDPLLDEVERNLAEFRPRGGRG